MATSFEPETVVALQEIQQCKARYSHVLDAGYRCDSCGKGTRHVRYRCLDCPDVDICTQCFDLGVVPTSGNHSADHSLVLFSYVSMLFW